MPPPAPKRRRRCAAIPSTQALPGQLSLQARLLGYHTHAMGGIERERIPAALNLPEGISVEAAVAIGRIGDADSLPEKLRAREVPSTRRPLADVAFLGSFPAA